MRRHLVAVLSWAAVGAALPLGAGAPFVKSQAPGYYRMTLGDFEITALSDGTVSMRWAPLLSDFAKDRLDDALAQVYLRDPVEMSVNAFLVNTGAKLVLIDSGSGHLFGPTLGRLEHSLRAAGYRPEQVDEVYITHAHPDHLGGLAPNGSRAFPNAVVRLGRPDVDHWLSPAHLAAAAPDQKETFEGAQASIKPYVDAGKLKPIEADGELVRGVRAVASHGHTPGHTTYVVESKGETLVAIGDLLHLAAVQLSNPAVAVAFDTDQVAAVTQRQKTLAEAAAQGHLIAFAHVSFPGLGRLRRAWNGYVLVPANYTSLQ